MPEAVGRGLGNRLATDAVVCGTWEGGLWAYSASECSLWSFSSLVAGPGEEAAVRGERRVRLSQHPDWAVEGVEREEGGGRLALWGPRGAAVVELGAAAPASPAEESGPAECSLVQEALWAGQPDLRLLGVRFLSPGRLVLLTSDGLLRVFDSLRLDAPLHSVTVLAQSSVVRSLGERVVGFDLGPDHTAYVLLENGELYSAGLSMEALLEADEGLVEGPMVQSWSDEAEQWDFAQLLVLPAAVPVLVAATRSGILSHFLLLHHPSKGPVLHLYEQLKLPTKEAAKGESKGPVKLCADPRGRFAYLAVHADGVHHVELVWARELGSESHALGQTSHVSYLLAGSEVLWAAFAHPQAVALLRRDGAKASSKAAVRAVLLSLAPGPSGEAAETAASAEREWLESVEAVLAAKAPVPALRVASTSSEEAVSGAALGVAAGLRDSAKALREAKALAGRKVDELKTASQRQKAELTTQLGGWEAAAEAAGAGTERLRKAERRQAEVVGRVRAVLGASKASASAAELRQLAVLGQAREAVGRLGERAASLKASARDDASAARAPRPQPFASPSTRPLSRTLQQRQTALNALQHKLASLQQQF